MKNKEGKLMSSSKSASRVWITALVGAGVLLATTSAWAVPFTPTACNVSTASTLSGVDLFNNVTNTTDCQYADGPTNSLNDRNNDINDSAVLDPGFFGHQDWIQTNDYFNAGYGTTVSDFNIADDLGLSFGVNDEVMLLFKDGGNTSTWVSYIVDDWAADFSVLDNMWGELYGNDKGISHISIYYRAGGGSVPMPEPGVLGLLAVGLLGLRATRHRRQAGTRQTR